MNAANFFLAVTLLTAPPEFEDVSPPGDWSGFSSAAQQLAVQWEIMDPREKNYILYDVKNFRGDITMLRVRYFDMKDAPRTWEANRLPPRPFCNEMSGFNRRYRKHLEERLELEQDRRAILTEAIGETEELFRIWDAARDAQCEYYYVIHRRRALKRLKELMGDEDYAEMRLPPSVPLWRFNELK